jgi:hypothetical protein
VVAEPPPSLASQLADSAARHAVRALEFYVRGEPPEDFYLHVGTALELAVKARIAEHNSAFLAPEGTKWFGPALALGRGQPVPPNLAQRITSVGAQDALSRLRQLEPKLGTVLRQDLNDLFELRNHVAHLGWSDPSEDLQREHASVFVRAITVLLRTGLTTFWGDFAGVAKDLFKRGVDHARSSWELKRANAQERVRVYGEQLHIVIQANDSKIAGQGDIDTVVLQCPVCGAEGLGVGELVDQGDVDFEWEDGENVAYWAYDLRVLVAEFQCAVCGLHLVGDELEAAGMETSVENPDATPGDVYSSDDY